MGGRKDRRTDVWTDGRMDGRTEWTNETFFEIMVTCTNSKTDVYLLIKL